MSADLRPRRLAALARERETRTNNAAPHQSHGVERRSPTGITRETCQPRLPALGAHPGSTTGC